MFAKERQDKICHLLEQKSSVTVTELMELFNVSTETIRRDLYSLEQSNCLKRVHGGAISLTSSYRVEQLEKRMTEQWEEKYTLSRTAARMIRDGDIIAMDAGSTAVAFAQVLKENFRQLTVLTNSLDAFQILSESLHPILCGGEFLKSENAFYGDVTCQMLEQYHVSKSFVFPSAISLKYGFMSCTPELIPIQKKLRSIGEQVMILADSTKFESTSFAKMWDITEQEILITDSGLSAEIGQKYHKRGLTVITEG
ncbi:MAG: DeoR/GlpR transcriptional regulator [Ruminococcaceae bacterium]|nr:DeoR/GlpR transcriptional regulator [Oscillospiraceae bacterium]